MGTLSSGGNAGLLIAGGGGLACSGAGAGASGAFGVGGSGGANVASVSILGIPITLGAGGAGGGGGYFGGGGGGACLASSTAAAGGGGGGSNFASAQATNVVMGVDSTTGANGSVSISPATPSLLTPPTITGTNTVGQTLSVVPGTYINAPSKTYQWYRCDASGNDCGQLLGATNTSWALTDADLGATLRVQETAGGAGGTAAPVLSAQTPVITQPAPPQPGATTQQPAGASQPAAVLPQLELGSVTAAGAQAIVHLSCSGTTGGGCSGSIAFHATQPGTAATKRRTRHPNVTVGRTTFTLASGKSVSLTIKLNATGRRLLGEFYRLSTHLTISGTTAFSRPVTFAYPRVRSPVTWTWRYVGTHTIIDQLGVAQIPDGGHVTLLCQGPGCQSSHQSFAPKHGHSVALARSIAKGGTLTAGAKLQIEISAPNSVAKVLSIAIRPNNFPSVTEACQPPGSAGPEACARPGLRPVTAR